jgi:hypothetical protein
MFHDLKEIRVVVATGYGLDDREVEVRVPVGSSIFFSPRRLTDFGAQRTYPMRTKGCSPWVKRPEREADYSPPTNAEIKKTWIYTSPPPYVFVA